MLFYDYEHNGILLAVFISNVISLVCLIIITFFYLKSKGSFLILKLYMYQVIILYFFFVPQIFGPFFLHQDADDYGEFCLFKKEGNPESLKHPQKEECMPDWFCRIQGVTNNGSWFASACFSILTYRIISSTLEVSSSSIQDIYNYYWKIILFSIIACNFPSWFAPFDHYGVTWKDDRAYYICNLQLVTHGYWMFWWIIQLLINAAVLVLAIYFFCVVNKRIKDLKNSINFDLNSIKTLKITLIGILLTVVWTTNIILKIIDLKLIDNHEIPCHTLSLLWFLPQLFVQWMGFIYFEMFFYCFQDQIQKNLSPKMRKVFNFFYRYNIITFFYSDHNKITDYSSSINSMLKPEMSNEASLLYKHDETSTN